MNYSYEQIGTVCATFSCHDDVQPGQPCQLINNDTIYLAEEESHFDGIVMSRRGDCAAVILRGFVTVPYTGTAPYTGNNFLQSNGIGGVCVASSGTACLVVHVDTVNQTVTFLM